MPHMKRIATKFTKNTIHKRTQIPEVSIRQEITRQAIHTRVKVKTNPKQVIANLNLPSINWSINKNHLLA